MGTTARERGSSAIRRFRCTVSPATSPPLSSGSSAMPDGMSRDRRSSSTAAGPSIDGYCVSLSRHCPWGDEASIVRDLGARAAGGGSPAGPTRGQGALPPPRPTASRPPPRPHPRPAPPPPPPPPRPRPSPGGCPAPGATKPVAHPWPPPPAAGLALALRLLFPHQPKDDQVPRPPRPPIQETQEPLGSQ